MASNRFRRDRSGDGGIGITDFLLALKQSIGERMFPPPIDSVDALGRFVGQRAAYVAQTSLYGYLKTRMGAKFPQYFEDPSFAADIKVAAIRQFVSCASDLSIFAVAVTASDGRLTDAEAAALARMSFEIALSTGLATALRDRALFGTTEAFVGRALATNWADAAIGDAAFAVSINDLIRNAPVIDEFKRLDAKIVKNSIRFRWVDVRDQLRRRLAAEAVCDDWRHSSRA